MPLDESATDIGRAAVAREGLVVVLTGAGVSAESGVPTFRGPEGFWTIGSTRYTPMELATRQMFRREPEWVWSWYLWRLGLCRAAEPNAAHEAIVRLERALGERFRLVTQNVDGLHLRAGTSRARMYAIHGDISLMRCAAECGADVVPVPVEVDGHERTTELNADERAALRCGLCDSWMRPHVLWFDEVYDEERYRFHSTIRDARAAALLVTVGTSGATNLPVQAAEGAVASGAALIDVNPESNAFRDMVGLASAGAQVRAPAAAALPALVEVLIEAAEAAEVS